VSEKPRHWDKLTAEEKRTLRKDVLGMVDFIKAYGVYERK
jgi:hypothetical protein